MRARLTLCRLVAIPVLLAAAALTGCGSDDDPYSKPKEDAASDCTPSADNNGCRGEIYADGYPEGHSGTDDSMPGDGFGDFAAHDVVGSNDVIIVFIPKDGHTDKTVKAANKYISKYIDGGDPDDFTWVKVIVDNTEGTDPVMPELINLRAVINGGEQADGSLILDGYLFDDVYGDDATLDPDTDNLNTDETNTLYDIQSKVFGAAPDEVLPGTTATFPGMLVGKVESVDSVWIDDQQAGSTD